MSGAFTAGVERTDRVLDFAIRSGYPIVLPQMLLCGLFVARSEMAEWLRVISAALPLTYAYDALSRVAGGGTGSAHFAFDIAITVGATLAALAFGAATLRRRTP